MLLLDCRFVTRYVAIQVAIGYVSHTNSLYTDDVMTRFWSFYRIQNLNSACSYTRLTSGNYNSLVIDFRSYLVCFRPCISQCAGFN